MDFDLTPEQLAIEELAATVFGDLSTPAAIRAVEHADPDRFDRSLWKALAEAGLLGVVVPTEHGGAGLAVVELCFLLEEVGRRTAAVPAFAALALGAYPLARFGTAEQQGAFLPGIAGGTTIVTAALVEPFGDPRVPSLAATVDGTSRVLDGVRTNVPAGTVADAVLVPAMVDGMVEVLIVDGAAPGVTVERQDTTSGVPEARIRFEGVHVAETSVLGRTRGAEALGAMVDVATVGTCAVMAGVTAEAVRLIGEYTSARNQFGHPIAEFQAVTQRAADAYVDSGAVHLTMLQAAWRLDAGLPADRELAVAKHWAAAGGQRALHGAMHLHGGMGVDRDYPLHRYFLLGKQLELYLGGSTRQLLELGRILADEGAVR